MKTVLLLIALTTITACGKKSAMDKRNNPTPPGDAPVTLDDGMNWKSTEPMEATVTYDSSKIRVGELVSNLSVRNESFKIPQELKVVQGFADREKTATLTLTTTGSQIVCTYKSQATETQVAIVPLIPEEERNKGLKYTFSHCTNTNIDPTVMIDDFDYVVLRVNDASKMETLTKVEAQIKLYQ